MAPRFAVEEILTRVAAKWGKEERREEALAAAAATTDNCETVETSVGCSPKLNERDSLDGKKF